MPINGKSEVSGLSKKAIFSIIIIFIINQIPLQSQREFTRYSEFGGKIGWSPINNVTMVNRNKPVVFDNSLLGVRFLHVEQKYAGILFEINYNKSTTTFEGNYYSYDFIQTPLMTSIFVPIKRTAAALNIGSYLQIITDKSSSEILIERDVLFGLAGGVSFSFPIKNISFTLEGRYNNNLFSNSKKDYSKLGNWFEFSISANFRKEWKKTDVLNHVPTL